MIKHGQRCVCDEGGQWWFLLKGGGRTRVWPQTCAQCGEEFVAYLKRVTCSRRCAGLRKRKPESEIPERLCEWCKQPFRSRDSRQRRCSHRCAAEEMHSRREVTTPDSEEPINASNPSFSRDDSGQWWYLAGPSASRTRAYIKKCERCGRSALRSIFHKTRFCTRRCAVLQAAAENRKARSGDNSHLWNGGKIRRRGYVLVYAPDHHSVLGTGRKYVLEHRVVMEQVLGRPLDRHEQVHHKNGVRDDNKPENLELWMIQHPAGQRSHEQQHCPTCTCFARGSEP
jgi:hypothetical protein